jgi:hypothetical protein
MPLLDAPALQLRIQTEDALGILEAILKQRHWRNFELANLGLVYTPYWFFNYDVYREVAEKSESFSSQMCLNARTGELVPMIVQITKELPLEKSTEITHNVSFETEKPTVQESEVKEIAQIKIAGQLGIPRSNVTISAINLMYVPTYQIWVTLSSGIRKVELDGMSGSPLNIEEVPARERGFLEVTRDTLEELKTPKGWVDYSKKAFYWGLGVSTSATLEAGRHLRGGGSLLNWMFTTKIGRYTAGAIIVLLLILLIMLKARF